MVFHHRVSFSATPSLVMGVLQRGNTLWMFLTILWCHNWFSVRSLALASAHEGQWWTSSTLWQMASLIFPFVLIYLLPQENKNYSYGVFKIAHCLWVMRHHCFPTCLWYCSLYSGYSNIQGPRLLFSPSHDWFIFVALVCFCYLKSFFAPIFLPSVFLPLHPAEETNWFFSSCLLYLKKLFQRESWGDETSHELSCRVDHLALCLLPPFPAIGETLSCGFFFFRAVYTSFLSLWVCLSQV